MRAPGHGVKARGLGEEQATTPGEPLTFLWPPRRVREEPSTDASGRTGRTERSPRASPAWNPCPGLRSGTGPDRAFVLQVGGPHDPPVSGRAASCGWATFPSQSSVHGPS